MKAGSAAYAPGGDFIQPPPVTEDCVRVGVGVGGKKIVAVGLGIGDRVGGGNGAGVGEQVPVGVIDGIGPGGRGVIGG